MYIKIVKKCIFNIAVIEDKMFAPSINDGDIWSDYNAIKYKIVLDYLFKVFNIDCRV